MPERPTGQKLVLCCGRKRCPAVEQLEDGRFRLSDEDLGVELVLERDQAALLGTYLAEHLRGAR